MIQRITGGETPLKATLDDKVFYTKNRSKPDPQHRSHFLRVCPGGSELAARNWFLQTAFYQQFKAHCKSFKEYVGQIPIKVPDKADQKPVERLV